MIVVAISSMLKDLVTLIGPPGFTNRTTTCSYMYRYGNVYGTHNVDDTVNK